MCLPDMTETSNLPLDHVIRFHREALLGQSRCLPGRRAFASALASR